MKKVLVLMATYNGECFLEEQLQSLLRQKNVNIDILVRDDGSHDHTKSILDNWEKQGSLKWYTGKHLDVQYGFYDLMEHAVSYDADYIAFCDQDDVWDKNKLSIAVQKLQEVDTSNPSLYYCGQRLVDSNMHFLSDHILNKHRNMYTRFLLSDIAGCTAVFNRALLVKILAYKPNYMLMHDTWILKVCLALGGNVIVDPNPHMDYRQHENNTIGLKKGFLSSLKQAHQYITKYQVEKQMRELEKGYGNSIIPEYKKLINCVCDYKHSLRARRKLLDKSYINFYNKGLNLTYFIKIMINRL